MTSYKKYSPTKREDKSSKKRIILLVALGVILLLALLFVLDRKGVISLPFLADKKSPPSPTGTSINYGPPTEQEKTETQVFKESLGDETTPTPTPPSPGTTKKSVTPIMTSWGASPNAEVRGYIPGIVEEDGTCLLTLTKGDQKVTESKASTPDAKTVSCGLISIARDRLSAGKWSATLSYSSANYEGVSTSNTIEVN